MNFQIIISGPPGTGKTSLGKLIARELALPFFYKDQIKESLFDTLGWSDAAWSKKLGTASMEILYRLLEAQLESNASFVFEANFKPETDKPILQRLTSRYGTNFIELFCYAEPAVIVQRFNSRILHKRRHPGHHSIPMEKEALEAYLHQYTPLHIGNLIELNTTDFSQINTSSLISEIKNLAVTTQIPIHA